MTGNQARLPDFTRVPGGLARGGYGLSHGPRLALVALIGIHAVRTRRADDARLQAALAEYDFRFRPAEVRALLGCGSHVYDWIGRLAGAGILVERDLGYETRWAIALPESDDEITPFPVYFRWLHGLSPTEASVWLTLKSAEGLRQPPNLKQIAIWAGVSVKSAHAIIHRLQVSERLSIASRRDAKGRQSRNRYILPDQNEKFPQGESVNSPKVNQCSPKVNRIVPQGESVNSPKVNAFGRDKDSVEMRGEIQGREKGYSPPPLRDAEPCTDLAFGPIGVVESKKPQSCEADSNTAKLRKTA